MNLPSWVLKVTTVWTGIGTLLMLAGANGIHIPGIVLQIFAQNFVDAVVLLIGAIVAFLQFARLHFAVVKSLQPGAEIKTLSVGQRANFALKFWRLEAA